MKNEVVPVNPCECPYHVAQREAGRVIKPETAALLAMECKCFGNDEVAIECNRCRALSALEAQPSTDPTLSYCGTWVNTGCDAPITCEKCQTCGAHCMCWVAQPSEAGRENGERAQVGVFSRDVERFIDNHRIVCDGCQHEMIDVTAARTGGGSHVIAGDPEGEGSACAHCQALSSCCCGEAQRDLQMMKGAEVRQLRRDLEERDKQIAEWEAADLHSAHMTHDHLARIKGLEEQLAAARDEIAQHDLWREEAYRMIGEAREALKPMKDIYLQYPAVAHPVYKRAAEVYDSISAERQEAK